MANIESDTFHTDSTDSLIFDKIIKNYKPVLKKKRLHIKNIFPSYLNFSIIKSNEEFLKIKNSINNQLHDGIINYRQIIKILTSREMLRDIIKTLNQKCKEEKTQKGNNSCRLLTSILPRIEHVYILNLKNEEKLKSYCKYIVMYDVKEYVYLNKINVNHIKVNEMEVILQNVYFRSVLDLSNNNLSSFIRSEKNKKIYMINLGSKSKVTKKEGEDSDNNNAVVKRKSDGLPAIFDIVDISRIKKLENSEEQSYFEKCNI